MIDEKNLVVEIMAFEAGDMDKNGVLELFAYLIKRGQAWSLQGTYGRIANSLIQQGYISRTGTILRSD